MLAVMYTIIAMLVVFITMGLILVVSALRTAKRQRILANGGVKEKLSLRERARRYVGPVKPHMPLFNPPARVAIEFFTALCGFPGLGWIISGNVFTGLVLISVTPAFVWAFFPAYATVSGLWSPNPFIIFYDLPFLALISSGGLAINQVVLARRRGERVEH